VPENQIAAVKGISAIQQNHVRLNGGKQAAYKNPLQIAASHGQRFVILFIAALKLLERNIQTPSLHSAC
jgi:RNA:NAD 2'-phosphotransferase (TPT1/KptA family)